jgi:uncharacterized protein
VVPPGSEVPTTVPLASSATTTTPVATVTVPPAPDTGDVGGFPVASITIAGEPWTVAVAEGFAARARGLMGVTDLGDLDGMVFVWDGAEPRTFTMRNTLIPLDVAFFDADGRLTEVVSMVPCAEEPCPAYPSTGAVRWAVEAPPGSFDRFPPGSPIALGG